MNTSTTHHVSRQMSPAAPVPEASQHSRYQILSYPVRAADAAAWRTLSELERDGWEIVGLDSHEARLRRRRALHAS